MKHQGKTCIYGCLKMKRDSLVYIIKHYIASTGWAEYNDLKTKN